MLVTLLFPSYKVDKAEFTKFTGVDMGIFMWWTMTTLTGKCMLLEGVLTLLSTAKAIDFLHLMTGLRKRWPSMRLHQRVNGSTGTGGPKGICCWTEPTSGSREQVHLLAMLGHIAWVQDHLLWWAQWPWLLVHSIVGRVPAANWAHWTPSLSAKKNCEGN